MLGHKFVVDWNKSSNSDGVVMAIAPLWFSGAAFAAAVLALGFAGVLLKRRSNAFYRNLLVAGVFATLSFSDEVLRSATSEGGISLVVLGSLGRVAYAFILVSAFSGPAVAPD